MNYGIVYFSITEESSKEEIQITYNYIFMLNVALINGMIYVKFMIKMGKLEILKYLLQTIESKK